MNGGFDLIKGILCLGGAATYNAARDHKTNKLVAKRNARYYAHPFSNKVHEVYNDVMLKHHQVNSLGETTWGVAALKGFSISHAQAMVVIHELIYREIKYDPYQVYEESGYQQELDRGNEFNNV